MDSSDSFETVPMSSPDRAAAHILMGRQLHDAGQVDAAESCYREAMQLVPDEPACWLGLGAAFQDRGEYDQAVTAYRVALVLDPSLYDAHFNLAGLLEASGDVRGAFRHLALCRQLRRSAPS